ncbi:hypothetical protein BVX95_00655 [archaeon D22]|nr:hypothetical protein BVX95_00655 [archaeon D22]
MNKKNLFISNFKMKEEKKHFMKRASIFILIFVSIFLLLDHTYLILHSNYDSRIQKDRFFDDQITKKNIEILFLGDSHAEKGINTELISNNSFNYAIAGDSYFQDYYKLKRILDENKTELKYIFLEIDLHTFSAFNISNELRNELDYYLPIADKNEILEISNEDSIPLSYYIYSKFKSIGKLEDLIKYFLINFLEKHKIRTKNEEKKFTQIKNKEILIIDKVNGDFKNKKRINEVNYNYFIRTLTLAKKSNITVILIKYPVTNEYLNEIKNRNIEIEGYYKKIENSVTQVFESCDQLNFPFIKNDFEDCSKNDYYYLDYQELFTNNSDYFYDVTHLNKIGSKQLSKQIQKDLLNIRIILSE